MQTIDIETRLKNEVTDITDGISKIVRNSKIKQGFCLIYCPHTTCSVIINENYDPSVKQDILDALNRLIPEDNNYKHKEGNSPAHIKSVMLGNSVMIPVQDNKLQLGQWQGILLAEFDGPRKRSIDVLVR